MGFIRPNSVLSLSLSLSFLHHLSLSLSLFPLSFFSFFVQKPTPPHLFMDIPNHKTTTNSTSSSSSWDLDMTMSMSNHLLLDQIQTPYEFLNPNNLDQFPPSSHHLPSSTFPTNPQFLDADIIHDQEDEEEGLGAMKEMMYKIAAMQPVDIDPSTIKKPKRRNVRISDDPQSIAARHRRERISERIRILQRLVPGGTKMDTASMLDEAIRYVKFLKRQVQELQANPPQAVGVVSGHPVVPMDWNVRAESHHHHHHHGLGSSSSSSMGGGHHGLGFGFHSDGGPSERMG